MKLVPPIYNVHPYFSLKILGKKICIIHGKIWSVCVSMQVLLMSQRGGLQSAPKCRLIKSQILRYKLGKYAVKPLLQRNLKMGIFAYSLCTEPGCIATQGCFCARLKTTSLFAIFPAGFVNASSDYYQSQVIWGPVSLVVAKKLGQLGFIVGVSWREKVGSKEDHNHPPRCMLLGRWTLSQWLLKCVVSPLPGKTGRGVFASSLCTKPWGYSQGECSHTHTH